MFVWGGIRPLASPTIITSGPFCWCIAFFMLIKKKKDLPAPHPPTFVVLFFFLRQIDGSMPSTKEDKVLAGLCCSSWNGGHLGSARAAPANLAAWQLACSDNTTLSSHPYCKVDTPRPPLSCLTSVGPMTSGPESLGPGRSPAWSLRTKENPRLCQSLAS